MKEKVGFSIERGDFGITEHIRIQKKTSFSVLNSNNSATFRSLFLYCLCGITMDEPIFPPIVEVVSDAVILWDHHLGSILYSNGFFGKPLGLRKTKPGNQQRPLSLSLFDALFLLENNVIQIKIQEKLMTLGQFLDYCKKLYENFEKKYAIYKFLREQGYVVRPGMKFGSDFAIYEIGPGFDHSKYVVHVENDELMLRAINIVRAGRLAASVKKQYLIATPQKNNQPNFYSFDRVKI